MAPPASSAVRPKRAAEEWARAHDDDATKRPRFDSRNPSTLAADARAGDDMVLNADVIGKAGPQTKRNAVNIDGYESDSDNDNFDARARARGRGQGGEGDGDDEDDMFADLPAAGGEDEEGGGRGDGTAGRKAVRFLDPSDIEGQVMNSTSGGRVSADLVPGGKGTRHSDGESEPSGDEEERDRLPDEVEEEDAHELGAGSKKKHAPRLEAFNLKEEEEEGRYDEAGNYVRKAADPDAVNDRWLEGLSKKDMKRAKEAQEKREGERRRRAMADDVILTSDLLSTLIARLERGETALEALQRLNKGKQAEKKKKVPQWKQKKLLLQDKMETDERAAEGNGRGDAQEEARRTAVESITGAADALYSRGQHEIYEAEREVLMRQYARDTGHDWASPQRNACGGNDGASAGWVYRWSDARDGGEAHGPYDSHTMQSWNDAGYFGQGVQFRRIGEDEWSGQLDFANPDLTMRP